MVDELEEPADELPATPGTLAEEHPEVWEAYSELGEACATAGPIDDETKRLIKLGMAIAAQSEGAVHSHVRRALDEGIDPEAIEQVAILSIPTVGFPQAMAGRSWIRDLTDEE